MADLVILLHGAGRSPRSMERMTKVLVQQSYQVHNLGYPSRHAPIEGLANHIGEQLHQIQPDPNSKINFVTHSLGGIVLRHILKHNHLPNLGRVVMLAPPNQGAELADFFGRFPLYHWILGPVGAQIDTRAESIPNTLGPADYEVGIIAGNRSLNPLLSLLIHGQDDGRIAVKHTRLAGMTDFLVLPCIHPLIMNYKQTIRQTLRFLAQGCFDHLNLA